MGWKNIKDHYRIGHIVQVRDGRICIGSPYVSDLIRVAFDGTVTWGNLGPSKNDDLARYFKEMTADLTKLKELIDTPDTFQQSLTVFTYDDGQIIEKQCEQLGWPHATHDGLIQYENTFSADKDRVVAWAKRNAASGIRLLTEAIKETEATLARQRSTLAKDQAELARLEADYPTNNPSSP